MTLNKVMACLCLGAQLVLLQMGLPATAQAGAVYDVTVFTGNAGNLGRQDDGPSAEVNLGFAVRFFGITATRLFVHNNGNISFTSPLTDYAPANFALAGMPVIAPLYSDVDTRAAASGVVTYGTAQIGSHTVFGVNWVRVGYWAQQTDHLNSFQLLIIDRNDVATGAFDFVFNYDTIQWDSARLVAEDGTVVNAPSAGRAGWTDGNGHGSELAGSGVINAMLDGGPSSLVSGSFNSLVAGRYYFSVRDGMVVHSTLLAPIALPASSNSQVPEPPLPGLLLAAAAAAAWLSHSRRTSLS